MYSPEPQTSLQVMHWFKTHPASAEAVCHAAVTTPGGAMVVALVAVAEEVLVGASVLVVVAILEAAAPQETGNVDAIDPSFETPLAKR